MKLSIIIPYYNGEQWIGACLDSLLRQDLPADEYEIIVVDDGSSHSIITLMKYVNDNSNIHYFHQKNQKHSAARNYGLTVAKGEYVFFCECDDFVADNVLGRLCDIAKEERADILLFGHNCVQDGEEPATTKRDFDNILRFESGMAYMSQPPHQFSGGVWQFLIRRGFMVEKGLQFDAQMINCEEHLFFLQMMLSAGTVAKVDVDVYYYVPHPTSWVHKEGKINHTEVYIDSMFSYLKYLTHTREQLADEGAVSAGLLDAMQKGEARETFSILTNKFRFSTIKGNKEMLDQLRSLGYYPIRRKLAKYDWIRSVMNVYPLWMGLCCCYHILPRKVRERLV